MSASGPSGIVESSAFGWVDLDLPFAAALALAGFFGSAANDGAATRLAADSATLKAIIVLEKVDMELKGFRLWVLIDQRRRGFGQRQACELRALQYGPIIAVAGTIV